MAKREEPVAASQPRRWRRGVLRQSSPQYAGALVKLDNKGNARHIIWSEDVDDNLVPARKRLRGKQPVDKSGDMPEDKGHKVRCWQG